MMMAVDLENRVNTKFQCNWSISLKDVTFLNNRPINKKILKYCIRIRFDVKYK